MQNSTPSITPYAQQCLQAFKKYQGELTSLESFDEAETDDAKLLLIGQLITDLDDIYNVDGQSTKNWKIAYHLFYRATDKYFKDPYIQHLISTTP